MSETEFDRIRSEGDYKEPYVLNFKEHGNDELHTHPFDALVFVTNGEFTLKFESSEQHMRSGDLCLVEANRLHAELCGDGPAMAVVAARPVQTPDAR